MSMTWRDYDVIAQGFQKALATSKYESAHYGIMDAVLAVADSLQAANGNFDRPQFLIACGYSPESKAVIGG